jgi:hypothetical protein
MDGQNEWAFPIGEEGRDAMAETVMDENARLRARVADLTGLMAGHVDQAAELARLRGVVARLERERDHLLDNWPGPNTVGFDQRDGKYYLSDDRSVKYRHLRNAARAAAGLDAGDDSPPPTP